MSLHATARRVAGLRHEIGINGRHVLVTDEPESIGGTDAGPTPHELLPAALAGCIATMISLYAQTRGWELGQVAVDIAYDNKAVPRRFEIEIRLPDSLSPAQLERLERVADTCPLRRALETGFEFEERIVTDGAPHRSQAAQPVEPDCGPPDSHVLDAGADRGARADTTSVLIRPASAEDDRRRVNLVAGAE